MFEQYSLIKLDEDEISNKEIVDGGYNPFHPEDFQFIWLGEIPNMQGHCVIIGFGTGKIYSGYHSERFRLLRDDE